MNIKTKFSVSDFAKRKYDQQLKDQFQILEVMQIHSETCYAGTQVFYLCRMLFAKKEKSYVANPGEEVQWAISHSIGKEEHSTGWLKYREDELVEITDGSDELLQAIQKD